MKTVKILAALVAATLLAACGPKTVIDGTLQDKADAPVVVKLLDVNKYQVLDTVRTDAAGTFSYKPEIQEGRPEFIYLFYGDKKVASLLLKQGDHVKVTADTLGNYTVEGSEESLLLQEVEGDYTQFRIDMNRLSNDPDATQELTRRYVDYYRRCVRYVMEHPKSLTSVPVMFQRVNDEMAVFEQATDGILFASICDSLKTVYPDSRYVKALEVEATRRTNILQLSQRLQDADRVGFFDIDLPNINGTNTKLSEVDAKVLMIYFWATADEQKLFNMDTLIPIYNEFHGRGFEIYAVSLDVDKSAWASVVKAQELPWINVCDSRGNQSPYITLYGLKTLPAAYFLIDGDMDPNATVDTVEAMRKYLQSKL
jgi:peroxiredoxin